MLATLGRVNAKRSYDFVGVARHKERAIAPVDNSLPCFLITLFVESGFGSYPFSLGLDVSE